MAFLALSSPKYKEQGDGDTQKPDSKFFFSWESILGANMFMGFDVCFIVIVPEATFLTIPLVAVTISLALLILMCLYQNSTVKQRSEGSSLHGFLCQKIF